MKTPPESAKRLLAIVNVLGRLDLRSLHANRPDTTVRSSGPKSCYDQVTDRQHNSIEPFPASKPPFPIQ